MSAYLELAEIEDAKKVVGQFTVEAWAGGWRATAYEGGPGSSICLFGSEERACLNEVGRLYSRGMVPMSAIPSSHYHAAALRARHAQQEADCHD